MTSFEMPYPAGRSPVLARNVVSTSQPLAAVAGLRMLQKGGNAVDAALAAAIALTVVEPTGNGLGSDAFAILWDGKALHGLNASGRSPAGWTPERFAGASAMPQRGWESVIVPGVVSAWVELSVRHGRLPFESLFEPALSYARDGFHVSPIIANLWKTGAALLKDQPGFAECFMPSGRVPVAGELFRNLAIAGSLQEIAETKGESFYRGRLAEKIVAEARENGAVLNGDDLAAHAADWSGTLSMQFHGAELHEIPPNTQGIAALMALGMLSHTDIADHEPDSAAALHLQIEAVKLAYADAQHYVADLSGMDVPARDMLEPDYLAKRASLIDPRRARVAEAGAPKRGGTVYVTAADESGMMVSFIQSNYAGFGSGVVVPGTGIHMQNRGFGFNLKDGHPNQVGPSKRPFHTIIPGFLMKDGAPLMSFGVMGGPMQAQGHVQMVVRTHLFKQNPQASSDAPRWRFVQEQKVAVESAMNPTVVQELVEMGHEISVETPDSAFGFGGAQLIQRMDNGGYIAGSDHRKDGMAVGF